MKPKPLPGDPDFNPLMEIPVEFRYPLSYFWAFHSALLSNMTCLCVRLKTWIRNEGLTLDELKPILHRLTEPDVVAEMRFPNDLLGKLAAGVAATIRLRKAAEASKANQKELEDRKNTLENEGNISVFQKLQEQLAARMAETNAKFGAAS